MMKVFSVRDLRVEAGGQQQPPQGPLTLGPCLRLPLLLPHWASFLWFKKKKKKPLSHLCCT